MSCSFRLSKSPISSSFQSSSLRRSVATPSIFFALGVFLAVGLATWDATAARAQVTFTGAQRYFGKGLVIPAAVAVDGSGNVFIADSSRRSVDEILAVNGSIPAQPTIKTLGSGFSSPAGVAVDQSGNVFVADYSASQVKEILAVDGSIPASPTINILGTGFNDPSGVAVDGSGNVFVADTGNQAVKEILSSSGFSTVVSLGSGFSNPAGVAVDGSGNVFVADTGNHAVKEILASSGYSTVVALGSGFHKPFAVAVDMSGNVFVADPSKKAIAEIQAVGGSIPANPTVVSLGSGFSKPQGVAVDRNDNVFIADSGIGQIDELYLQSVNFGSVNVCPSGQTTPAPCSNTLTLTYAFSANETLDPLKVLTQGAPGLDFTPGSGPTCIGLLTKGETCTVTVNFAPLAPGERNGAVQVLDENGNLLAATNIYGTGTGPAIAFSPTDQFTIGAGFGVPKGLAVDASGDVFFVDSISPFNPDDVYVILKDGKIAALPLANGFTFSGPSAVALDGSGNLFVADQGANEVYEALTEDAFASVKSVGHFGSGNNLAVDGSGNVFVSGADGIFEILAASAYTISVPIAQSAGSHPGSLAVDGSDNLFVTELVFDGFVITYRLFEIPAAGGYTTANPLGGTFSFGSPEALAVDASGNVYVADDQYSTLLEILPADGYSNVVTLGSGFGLPSGVAVDGSGNVFVAVTSGLTPSDATVPGSVQMIQRWVPPALSFASTNAGSTSTDSPQSVQFQNIGNTPLTGSFALSDTADFTVVAGPGTVPDCNGILALAPGAECNVSLSFTPQSGGALTSALTLSDNALNGSPATQSIRLSGFGQVGTQSQAITFIGLPSTAAYGSAGPYTLNATASSGLPVSYAATGPATLSGSTLTIIGAGTVKVTASQGGNATYAAATPVTQAIVVTATSTTGLQFIPVTPCRIADTRNPTGPFGGPEPAAGSTRVFNVPQSACKIPNTAVAYSLNVTVVPNAALGYLTMWPAGQTQPLVSTLNSDGRVKANAAIVPAGTNGGVSVYVTDATQVVLDIDGYFVPAGTTSALAFYPVTPCRLGDTRNPAGLLGGPSLAAGDSRVFPLRASNCNLPSTAQAYSLNVTAVPHTTLGYLTIWPTGGSQPLVSTLNAPTGAVTANAAIVPAGGGGDVSVFVDDAADVILDVDGYFAPPTTGGLSLYTVTPCRAIDTRPTAFTSTLTAKVEGSLCAPPATAEAYVLNATVVPDGALGYLTLWPAGASQPTVSTLNAADKAITSNLAIVPTTHGEVDAFADGTTNLILDLSGYFAP
jgi:sugar lactone lactonase YvrE